MGQWRGKYLDTGPPRGPGRYSEDGRWWWDDTHGRWFRTTSQEDVLEVEAEDVGGISLAASLVTTLSSQYGNGYFRFVARARSANPRWPTYAMAGATFPATRPSLEDVGAQGAWLATQRERFQELHQQLLAEGWRPAGHGPGGGRPSTGAPTSTGTPHPTPTNRPRGAHDAGAGHGGDQLRRHHPRPPRRSPRRWASTAWRPRSSRPSRSRRSTATTRWW